MSSNPLKKIESAVKSATGKVDDAATSGVSKIIRRADDQIGRIEDAGKLAEKEILKTVELITSQPFRLAAREALAFAVKVIETKPPDSLDLRVSAIRLEIHGIGSRLDTLRRWRDHPPKNAGDIREMIETLSPTRVHIATQLSLPVSDALSVGIRLDWTMHEFLSVYDRIIKLVKI